MARVAVSTVKGEVLMPRRRLADHGTEINHDCRSCVLNMELGAGMKDET
jgi:hypothetical protein